MNAEGLWNDPVLTVSCCSNDIRTESGAILLLLAGDTSNSPRDRKASQVPSKQGEEEMEIWR